MGSLTLDDVENHIFGQFVVAGTVGFEFLYFLFELGGLGLIAYDLDDRAAGHHAQFRKKVAQKLHVGVIDSVEADRVGAVDNYDSFNHVGG